MNLSLLALNLGSTSLKAASYLLSRDTDARETGRAMMDGFRMDHIGMDDVRYALPISIGEPDSLLSSVIAQLPSLREPDLVVLRIVHGGDRSSPLELSAALLNELDALSSLAPLHQPPALALARAAMQRWPGARHYGAFDTSWHLSMSQRNRLLPLPFALYAQGVKHYGFHGLAFQSAMKQLIRLEPDRAHGRVVLAHLGGGSSLCAVRGNKCFNTTMGLTPLGGIAMSTRPGSLDPGAILYLQRDLGISPADLDRMLWKESGLKGLSGESGDMRQLLASSSEQAQRAIEVYADGIVQGIAAMAASIGGIDILAFSGGIGMHAPAIRANVVGALDWLDLAIESDLNERSSEDLSCEGTRVRTFALHVDEEREMADGISRLGAWECLQ